MAQSDMFSRPSGDTGQMPARIGSKIGDANVLTNEIALSAGTRANKLKQV